MNTIDPEMIKIANADANANQPKFFDKTASLSMNLFDMPPAEELYVEIKEKVVDEDDKFFGTRIAEAKKTFKAMFKKNK